MALKSWVESANYASDFPRENLPFGIFRAGRNAHVGAAIGDRILDLAGCFADDLVAMRLQQAAQPVAKECMVVGDEDAHGEQYMGMR